MIPAAVILMIATYLAGSLFGPLMETHPWAFYSGCLFILILFSAQFWLFFVFFRSAFDSKLRFERPLQQFAFSSMGVISFLFTFTLIRDLGSVFLSLIQVPSDPLHSGTATLTLLLLTLFCVVWGTYNARVRVVVREVRVPIPDLPTNLEKLILVQLSDVHLGTGPNAGQVKSLIDRTLLLNPDLIVLTGDIIDGTPSTLTHELAELSRLKSRLGVFFVIGNHECYWNIESAVSAIRSCGITPLMNEGLTLEFFSEKIFIGGVTDPASRYFDGEGPKIPAPDLASPLRILLAHQPQIAKETAKHPYHLQLSGHTHGGQFFPWNWLVRGIYLHPGGLGKLKNLQVYVSHGTGFWGPPVRLGTDSEITVIKMVRETP